MNCLAASGGLIITVQPGGFEIRALAYLEATVRVVQKQVNPDLAVLGVLLGC